MYAVLVEDGSIAPTRTATPSTPPATMSATVNPGPPRYGGVPDSAPSSTMAAAALESRSFELGHREDRPVLRDRALMRGEGRQEPGIRVELSEGLRNSARGRHESVVTRRASVPARQQKLAVSCLVIRRAGALVLTPPKNGSAPNQRNFNAAGYLSFTARVLGLVAPVERTWIVAVPEV